MPPHDSEKVHFPSARSSNSRPALKLKGAIQKPPVGRGIPRQMVVIVRGSVPKNAVSADLF